MTYLGEAQVEIAAIDYFRELGYTILHGTAISPSEVSDKLYRFVKKRRLQCPEKTG